MTAFMYWTHWPHLSCARICHTLRSVTMLVCNLCVLYFSASIPDAAHAVSRSSPNQRKQPNVSWLFSKHTKTSQLQVGIRFHCKDVFMNGILYSYPLLRVSTWIGQIELLLAKDTGACLGIHSSKQAEATWLKPVRRQEKQKVRNI